MPTRRGFLARLLALPAAISLAQQGGVEAAASKPHIAEDLSIDVFTENLRYYKRLMAARASAPYLPGSRVRSFGRPSTKPNPAISSSVSNYVVSRVPANPYAPTT
jgi:hypothetical protein